MGIALMTHAQIPTNGLVGYWPFNGNANDESGNGNNGTVNGATLTTDRFGNLNSAYLFSGTNTSFIEVLDNNLLDLSNQLSLCAWINSNSLSLNDQAILGKGRSTTGTGYCLLYRSNNGSDIGFGMNDGVSFNGGIGASSTLVKSGWHFIVGTYNGSRLKFYIDEVLIDSTDAVLSLQNSSTNVYFGRETSGLSRYFSGSLDDIRIYNRAINQSEVSILYNEGICMTSITVTDTLMIQLNLTSYKPMTFETTIKVYPNPTKDVLYINCGDYTKVSNYKLKITNSLSQEIWSTTITQNNYNVNMSSFGGTGLYFMEVYDANNNKIDVKKIVLY